MADFQCIGNIMNIKFLKDSILIVVDEYKRGYKKANGEKVDEKILTWRCLFSGNESKRAYINKFFNRGSYVQIKGEIVPYAIENGKLIEDSYTVYVQTINLAAYPRQMLKQERRMMKESQENSFDKPNLDAYNESDF